MDDGRHTTLIHLSNRKEGGTYLYIGMYVKCVSQNETINARRNTHDT